MARIVVPLNEAIHIFSSNVQLGNIITRIDATEQGPRLAVKVSPISRETYITIRFTGFENGTALFALDGLPPFISIGSFLKLPEGITVSGSKLRINADTLIRTQLKLKGLAVRSVAWQDGAYVIDTGIY